MAHYVDSFSQTIIAGLTKHPAPVPTVLSHHSDATTPPDEMPSKELQIPSEATPSILESDMDHPSVSPTLLLRRKNRPPLIARISLPPSEYAEEAPRSPPPTLAVMSPLPAANLLHAGHTPIFPRSMSPLHMPEDRDRSERSTPDREHEDIALSGPLTLPPQPGDGAEDTISLKALDAELERVAQQQEIASRHSETISSPVVTEMSGTASCKTSSRRSSENDPDIVDGVILKKPKLNFGQPLGQA